MSLVRSSLLCLKRNHVDCGRCKASPFWQGLGASEIKSCDKYEIFCPKIKKHSIDLCNSELSKVYVRYFIQSLKDST